MLRKTNKELSYEAMNELSDKNGQNEFEDDQNDPDEFNNASKRERFTAWIKNLGRKLFSLTAKFIMSLALLVVGAALLGLFFSGVVVPITFMTPLAILMIGLGGIVIGFQGLCSFAHSKMLDTPWENGKIDTALGFVAEIHVLAVKFFLTLLKSFNFKKRMKGYKSLRFRVLHAACYLCVGITFIVYPPALVALLSLVSVATFLAYPPVGFGIITVLLIAFAVLLTGAVLDYRHHRSGKVHDEQENSQNADNIEHSQNFEPKRSVMSRIFCCLCSRADDKENENPNDLDF